MQNHRFHHRIVVLDKSAQGRIQFRKEFDVALARKTLREGATLSEVGAAMDRCPASVRARLGKLGLGYLVSDPVRVGEVRSKGQIKRLAGKGV